MTKNSFCVSVHQRAQGQAWRRIIKSSILSIGCAALLQASGQATLYTVDLNAPTVDKWQYPFGGSGGTRTSGSTFGAVGSAGFDDRDAQFYTGFQTSGLVPTGLGFESYLILSATFTLSLGITPSGDAPALVYDGTYDSINTFGLNGEPINGDDPGRPMELFGVGYRGGLTNTTVVNGSSFGTAGEGTRNLYATDFFGGESLAGANRDTSNNVTMAFEASPFAIGQVAPGDITGGLVNEDADIVFTLNLANPDVVRYLQYSLDEGVVSFLTTSLHQASQGGPISYPVYYANENLLGGLPGRLDLQVQTVPEPGSMALVFIGAGVAAFRRSARRTGDRKSEASKS